MKIKIIILLITFAYASGFALEIDNTIPLYANWHIGDKFKFKVTKIKQLYQGEQLVRNDTSSYITNFLVSDSTENEYTVNWKYQTSLSNYNIPESLSEKFAKYKFTEVVYKTGSSGEFLGIENWKEISEMMTGLFSDLIDYMADNDKPGMDKESLKKSLQPLSQIYSTRQGLELLVFKELQVFHYPYGLSYLEADTIAYEEQLPNMFGGDPIRGDVLLFVKSVDKENSEIVLKQEMRLNPDDVNDMINSVLQRMNLPADELEKSLKSSELEITDDNFFNFNYEKGIPNSIVTERNIVSNINNQNGKRIEITKIELIN